MNTCLLVDDSGLIRRITKDMVEPLGFQTKEAENGNVALSKCVEAMPDLILLDWNMPEKNGLEFLIELRALPGGDSPKVIMSTTENETPRIIEAMEAGANEYIMKPFDADILKDKILEVGFEL